MSNVSTANYNSSCEQSVVCRQSAIRSLEHLLLRFGKVIALFGVNQGGMTRSVDATKLNFQQ